MSVESGVRSVAIIAVTNARSSSLPVNYLDFAGSEVSMRNSTVLAPLTGANVSIRSNKLGASSQLRSNNVNPGAPVILVD